jgi:hypothetical protein
LVVMLTTRYHSACDRTVVVEAFYASHSLRPGCRRPAASTACYRSSAQEQSQDREDGRGRRRHLRA